ncbi:hypothetical protein NDN08_005312 [Rhodosorus marinus]|uniref:Uncharacterized protein n=1 Tax=Rhodosorus marinus TaxID=101924 RepID=A0AAV8V4M2_9RHOD|nr:hypothetical protein NDN08_005312 [Rhodosorus marinus]
MTEMIPLLEESETTTSQEMQERIILEPEMELTRYTGSRGKDVLHGEMGDDGNDDLNGAGGDYVVKGNDGSDVLDGSYGSHGLYVD